MASCVCANVQLPRAQPVGHLRQSYRAIARPRRTASLCAHLFVVLGKGVLSSVSRCDAALRKRVEPTGSAAAAATAAAAVAAAATPAAVTVAPAAAAAATLAAAVAAAAAAQEASRQ